MKRKSLFVIALALVIVGSMLAGTMAQYVKTAGAVLNPQFEQFNFSSAAVSGTTLSVKMAPGETKTWTFLVTNTENDVVSETDMKVSAGLVGSNLPPQMSFTVNGKPYTAGAIVAALKGGIADSFPVVIGATWNTNGDASDTEFEGYTAATVALAFTATQTADFLPLAVGLSSDGPDRATVAFDMPEAIDLALTSNSDIAIEYYYLNGSTKVPVLKASGDALVKSKYWSGYLVGPGSVYYANGYEAAGTYANNVAAGLHMLTTVYVKSDPTKTIVPAGWLKQGLHATVTINVAGKIYQGTAVMN